MSQVGDGTTLPEDPFAQASGGLGLEGGSRKIADQTSRPPFIHDDESSSSDESEGETSEARRRRKEKMKAEIKKKKVEKLTWRRIKEESDKHPFFGLHQLPRNYASSQYPSSQFNRLTWENLLSLMGWIIPSGLMTLKCTSTGFTPLFGKFSL
jgi:hypothetical protein